jgi:hypothetical protein
MRQIELLLTFTDDQGITRSEKQVVFPSYKAEIEGEYRLAHNLFAELQVSTGYQAPPKHNAIAHKWLDFPGQMASIEFFLISEILKNCGVNWQHW